MTVAEAAVDIRNSFRRALAGGRPLIGIWSMLNSSNVIEGLTECGYDWILIDGEHAPVSLADAINHLRAMRGSDVVPIVRLPWNDSVTIKQFLDAGATTLMLPYCQSVEEAQAAVAATYYPPKGVRGVAAMHRASRYGHDRSYMVNAHEAVSLILQIETLKALDSLEAIADVDGVDAVFFGPGDLAATMGHLGQPACEPVIEVIMEAHGRIRSRPVKAGVLAPTPELAERFIRAGFDFVSVANEAAMLFQSAAATAARFRKLAAEAQAAER